MMTHLITFSPNKREGISYGFLRDGQGQLFDFETVYNHLITHFNDGYVVRDLDYTFIFLDSGRAIGYDPNLSLDTMAIHIENAIEKYGRVVVGCYDKMRSDSSTGHFISYMILIERKP